MNPDDIPEPPAKLRDREIWLPWHYEEREDANGDPYQTKVPDSPHAAPRTGTGDATDPDKWVSYEDITVYVADYADDIDGIGFAFPVDDLLCGIDIDDVIDTETGDVRPWATDIIDTLDSYTEYSPSGSGYHVVVFGIKPGDRCKRKRDDGETEIECYEDGKFFTYTGNHVEDTPETVNQRNDELTDVYYEYLEERDETPETDTDGGVSVDTPNDDADIPEPTDTDLDDEVLLERARNAKHGAEFSLLERGDDSRHGNDTSAADQAFCNRLAFWTGGDRRQMDRLFRNSDRMRAKWDEDRGSQTYGELTIDEALSTVTERYEPGWSGDVPTFTPDSAAVDGGPDADFTTTPLADAILDEPGAWIDADEQVITAHAVEDYSADEVATMFRECELPDDARADIANSLDGEFEATFKDWYMDDGAGWTVEQTEPHQPLGATLARIAELRRDDPDISYKEAIHHAAEAFDTHGEYIRPSNQEDGWYANIHRYDAERGVYTQGDDITIAGTLKHHMREIATTRFITGVEDALAAIAGYATRSERLGTDAHRLAVGNGILDLRTGELDPHTPEEYHYVGLPTDYKPDATCPNIDAHLKAVVGEEQADTIVRLIAHCLYRGYPESKIGLFIGDGRNGKSTTMNMIREFLDGNTSQRSMKRLAEYPFAAQSLHGKMANINADIGVGQFDHAETIRQYSGGDWIEADVKNANETLSFVNHATLIFGMNKMPYFTEETAAMKHRFVPIEFDGRFFPDEEDHVREGDMLDTLSTAAEFEGLLARCVDEIVAWENGRAFFPDAPSLDGDERAFSPTGALPDAEQSAESIVMTFATERLDHSEGDEVRTSVVKDALDAFCQERGWRRIDKKTLTTTLTEMDGFDVGVGRLYPATDDGKRPKTYKNVTME